MNYRRRFSLQRVAFFARKNERLVSLCIMDRSPIDIITDDIWQLIIGCGCRQPGENWRVYAGLLAIPRFARLMMRDTARWRRFLTVKVELLEAHSKTCIGCLSWWLGTQLHNEDDLPARIWQDAHLALDAQNDRTWYKHGKMHRYGGPARIWHNRQEWWENGEQHRDNNLPAVMVGSVGTEWRVRGQLHRTDGPALIQAYSSTRTEEWHINGSLHRDGDLPAMVETDVKSGKIIKQAWYQRGDLHRHNGPALICQDKQEWWIDGLPHRADDLPAVERNNGTREWYQHGLRHRGGDQPAIISEDSQEWWVNGERHRFGHLPAVIHPGYKEWYWHGALVYDVEYHEEEDGRGEHDECSE